MTEYWKSIPKKYCDICKVWMQDNKISVEHHERGLSHQANVRKRLADIRKEGTVRAKEKAAHDAEIRRIEAAALKSFQADIAADPTKAKDLPTVTAGSSESSKYETQLPMSKFGETVGSESLNLARGREKALETIASKMQKKSKWLEAKTAEGNTYYWNRDTCETVWEPPKSGFLSLEEQESTGIHLTLPSSGASSSKMTPYGRWQEVAEPSPFTDETVDLQLPSSNHHLVEKEREEDIIYVEPDEGKQEGLFEEKSVESKVKKVKVEFKKRSLNSQAKRNVRKRETSP